MQEEIRNLQATLKGKAQQIEHLEREHNRQLKKLASRIQFYSDKVCTLEAQSLPSRLSTNEQKVGFGFYTLLSNNSSLPGSDLSYHSLCPWCKTLLWQCPLPIVHHLASCIDSIRINCYIQFLKECQIAQRGQRCVLELLKTRHWFVFPSFNAWDLSVCPQKLQVQVQALLTKIQQSEIEKLKQEELLKSNFENAVRAMEEEHVMALGQVSLGQSHFHSPLWDLELHCAGMQEMLWLCWWLLGRCWADPSPGWNLSESEGSRGSRPWLQCHNPLCHMFWNVLSVEWVILPSFKCFINW